jgi:tRNA 2-thiouridine synthesizing protein A
MTDYQEDSLMDCSGMNCPLPVLKTKKAIDGMNSGEILKMISTDPGSINDVNAFTKRTGHDLLESIAKDGDYTFFIRKS